MDRPAPGVSSAAAELLTDFANRTSFTMPRNSSTRWNGGDHQVRWPEEWNIGEKKKSSWRICHVPQWHPSSVNSWCYPPNQLAGGVGPVQSPSNANDPFMMYMLCEQEMHRKDQQQRSDEFQLLRDMKHRVMESDSRRQSNQPQIANQDDTEQFRGFPTQKWKHHT